MAKRIFIAAGDASGDIYGARLVNELKCLDSGSQFFGFGGRKMEQVGVELLYDLSTLSVVGLVEVLSKLSIFRRLLRLTSQILPQQSPDAVILIDNPGFNLRVAELARRDNIPVIYYVPPQVWAWGRKRVLKIARLVRKIIVILPFEEQIYKESGCDARFVGHPLLDIAQPTMSVQETYKYFNLDESKPVIGLLPGSRDQEVTRLLPIMLEAAWQIKEQFPEVQFAVSQAKTIKQIPPKDKPTGQADTPEGQALNRLLVQGQAYGAGRYPRRTSLRGRQIPVVTVKDKIYDLINISRLVLVSSGTATLECTCLETPMIIGYQLNPITLFMAKHLVKVKYFGLPNILAGDQIVPELLQNQLTHENISRLAVKLLKDGNYRQGMVQQLKLVKQKMGKPGASRRAAEIVLQTISEEKHLPSDRSSRF